MKIRKTMKIKTIAAVASACAALTLAFPVAAANKALESWKEFAAKSGNPDHAKWVTELSKPEAVKLAKEWRDFRGFDAYDLIAKENIPADLKPGLKISKANAAQYPWLTKYLPKEQYDAIMADDGYMREITIVPTNTYYMRAGVLDATKKMHAKGVQPQISKKGDLVNPDGSYTLINDETAGAMAFLNPKNGQELTWMMEADRFTTDDLWFSPISITSCTPQGVADRRYKAELWWQHFHGRDQNGVKSSVAGKPQFTLGGSLFFLEPFDIRGLAGVRQRYADAAKTDDFKVFIPSLRRTRVLTGSDSQDPLASGVELTWDDWATYWVKFDVEKFDYKLAGESVILATPEVGYAYDSTKFDDAKCRIKSMEMELRPVWKLEITDKTGKYQYSKRTMYIDKEIFVSQYQMNNDARGNPFRNYTDDRAWRPFDGRSQWRNVLIYNHVSKRFNANIMDSQWKNMETFITPRHFDVDQLRDYK